MPNLFRSLLLCSALFVLSSLSGCTSGARVQAAVVVEDPSLVYLGPDLWVVAGSNEPIFYSAGLYWLYRGGYWYRSSYYWGGWELRQPVYVPVVVRRIQRPRSYRDYRIRPGHRVRRAPAPDRRKRPVRRRNEQVPARRGGR